MKVNRALLYWGVFFLALGGVLLAAQANAVSDAAVADALRWWPVLLIAIGVGLVLRGTRLRIAGGMLAAAVPGLVLGGAVVAGPRLIAICGDGTGVPMTSQSANFAGPARVNVELRCGAAQLSTVPGTAWQLDAGSTSGSAATVTAAPDSLTVTSGRTGWFGSGSRDSWKLALPTGVTQDLTLGLDAGSARADLTGAQLGRVSLTVNAGDAHVDLSNATLTHLSVDLNAGAVRVALPAGSDFDGSITVDVGEARICTPEGLGLHIRSTVSLGSARYSGLVSSGGAWESPDYATAAHHAQLTIDTNVGSIELNPAGGCK